MKYSCLIFLLLLPVLLAQDSVRIERWSRHVTTAQELERQGDIVHAETEFRLAASEAQRSGTDPAAYASVLDAMGVFYDDIGKFVEAEQYLTRSLAMWRSVLGSEHFAIARVVDRLASLYLETNQIGKVERLDLGYWVHLVEAHDPASYDLVQLLERLGTLQALRGQHLESDRFYQRALDIVQQRGAARSIEEAVALNNLGLACLRAHRYDAAIEHLTVALEIWKQIRGPDDRNTGLTSHSLAMAYEATGEFDKAEPLVKQALSIAEKSFGPTSLRTASVLDTYARFLRERKRKPEAKKIEARVRQIVADAGPSLPSRQMVDVTELSLRSGR